MTPPTTGDKEKYATYLQDGRTDLAYADQRYYAPGSGRFMTADPAGDGLNWYAYVGGDPVNMVDRTGLGIISGEPLLNGASWCTYEAENGVRRLVGCVGSPTGLLPASIEDMALVSASMAMSMAAFSESAHSESTPSSCITEIFGGSGFDDLGSRTISSYPSRVLTTMFQGPHPLHSVRFGPLFEQDGTPSADAAETRPELIRNGFGAGAIGAHIVINNGPMSEWRSGFVSTPGHSIYYLMNDAPGGALLANHSADYRNALAGAIVILHELGHVYSKARNPDGSALFVGGLPDDANELTNFNNTSRVVEHCVRPWLTGGAWMSR